MKYMLTASVLFCAVFISLYAKDMSELEYAKALYEKGDLEKSASSLKLLMNDTDKELAEAAHYEWLIRFNDTLIPEKAESIDLDKDMTAFNDEYEEFIKKFPKSSLIPELKAEYEKRTSDFRELKKENARKVLLLLNDSSEISYSKDSSLTVKFSSKFQDTAGKDHKFEVSITGRINTYDPFGDMKDEWGSTGLVLDSDRSIEVLLDGKPVKEFKEPVHIKQYPEYVLRKVKKYGFVQDQTFVRDDPVINVKESGFYLSDKFIVPMMKLEIIYGIMDQLVPYYSDEEPAPFPENFNGRCYLRLNLMEI